ncbi:MAG: DUF4147 domain-containing protein [Nanoarchaeota archaeon]
MIITNYEEVSTNSLRKDALDILIAGVNAVLPANILNSKIKFNPQSRILTVENSSFPIKGDIYVIGFGKAAGFMAEQIEKAIGIDNIKIGAVIDKTNSGKTEKVKIYAGSHPVPEERNILASNELLILTQDLKQEDVVICLISGGGSSLFTIPVESIGLEDIKILTTELLKCGAEVFEINILRKHLDIAKGGKLLKHLQSAKIISIIFSDTIDTEYDATASGPTSPDKSTFADAYKVLEKYNLLEKTPQKIVEYIKINIGRTEEETLKQDNPLFTNTHNFILADNSTALNAMKRKAEELQYSKVNILTSNLKGESKEAAKKMSSFFKNASEKQVCLYAGETTVSVKGNGKGGRLQEYIAALIPEIYEINNCVVASFGSDGADFIDGIGGAIADNNTLSECQKQKIDIQEMLKKNNTYELHNLLGNLLKSSPTNTNVADLHVFIKG